MTIINYYKHLRWIENEEDTLLARAPEGASGCKEGC